MENETRIVCFPFDEHEVSYREAIRYMLKDLHEQNDRILYENMTKVWPSLPLIQRKVIEVLCLMSSAKFSNKV